MKVLYFIALLPPADLREEIHRIRLECSEKFGVKKALKPPVHITLYPPFRFEESYERQLTHILRRQTNDLHSFTQVLEGFGHFRKEVVFINALRSDALMSLQQAIREVFNKDEEERQGPAEFHPHLTIAYRDLTPAKFDSIWKEFGRRTYRAEFQANRFTLLKHDNVKWNPVKHFKLHGIV